MGKGNTTENDLMKFMFNATAMPSYGANLYLALHNADPTDTGTQETNETNYTNYTRIAISRDAAGWDVVDNQASNKSLAQFPQCGASGDTITHVSIGTSSTGAGQILYYGSLTDSLVVSNLVQPQFAVASLVITED